MIRGKKVQVWLFHRPSRRVALFLTGPTRGTQWHPVTGHVEVGEALDDAAYRELREETQLTREQVIMTRLGIDFHFSTPKGKFFETAFVAVTTTSVLQIDASEHVEYRWFSIEEAKRLLEFESHRRCLTEVDRVH